MMLEGLGGMPRPAPQRGELVRGRWLHTALVTLAVFVVVLGVGVVLGLLVLVVFTGLPLWALSAVVVVCNLLAMPFGALVMTFLYGDAVAVDTDLPLDEEEMAAETGERAGLALPGP